MFISYGEINQYTGTEMDEYVILISEIMSMLGLDYYIETCAFTYSEVCWVFKGNMYLVKVLKYIVHYLTILVIKFSHGQCFFKISIGNYQLPWPAKGKNERKLTF